MGKFQIFKPIKDFSKFVEISFPQVFPHSVENSCGKAKTTKFSVKFW